MACRSAGLPRNHRRGVFSSGFDLGECGGALLAAAPAQLGMEDERRRGPGDDALRSSLCSRRAPRTLIALVLCERPCHIRTTPRLPGRSARELPIPPIRRSLLPPPPVEPRYRASRLRLYIRPKI